MSGQIRDCNIYLLVFEEKIFSQKPQQYQSLLVEFFMKT